MNATAKTFGGEAMARKVLQAMQTGGGRATRKSIRSAVSVKDVFLRLLTGGGRKYDDARTAYQVATGEEVGVGRRRSTVMESARACSY